MKKLLESKAFCCGVTVGVNLYQRAVVTTHKRKEPLKIGDINTLEGGYNISGITGALDGIASGLNGVASAANNAASAMAAMGAAQSAAKPAVSANTSKNSKKFYEFTNPATGKYITSGNMTAVEAKKFSQNMGGLKYAAYASGTRNAKGGLRVINEEGQELTLPKLSAGNYAIGNDGDQILTKKETDNVYEWAKTTPEEFAGKENKTRENEYWNEEKREYLLKYVESIGGGLDENGYIVLDKREKAESIKSAGALLSAAEATQGAFAQACQIPLGSVVKQPEIRRTNAGNNNVTMHYDSLVTINGDVNDTKHFLNDMKNVAKNAVNESWHDFEMTRKYGMY